MNRFNNKSRSSPDLVPSTLNNAHLGDPINMTRAAESSDQLGANSPSKDWGQHDPLEAKRSRSMSPVRRFLAVTLVALASTVGIGAVSATPASAANYATITACVQTTTYVNGYPFKGKYLGPVYIDAYADGAWRHIASSRTSIYDGCVSWSPAVPGFYWRVSVQSYGGGVGGVWYAGASNYAYVAGNYTYNLGTFWV